MKAARSALSSWRKLPEHQSGAGFPDAGCGCEWRPALESQCSDWLVGPWFDPFRIGEKRTVARESQGFVRKEYPVPMAKGLSKVDSRRARESWQPQRSIRPSCNERWRLVQTGVLLE